MCTLAGVGILLAVLEFCLPHKKRQVRAECKRSREEAAPSLRVVREGFPEEAR